MMWEGPYSGTVVYLDSCPPVHSVLEIIEFVKTCLIQTSRVYYRVHMWLHYNCVVNILLVVGLGVGDDNSAHLV